MWFMRIKCISAGVNRDAVHLEGNWKFIRGTYDADSHEYIMLFVGGDFVDEDEDEVDGPGNFSEPNES